MRIRDHFDHHDHQLEKGLGLGRKAVAILCLVAAFWGIAILFDGKILKGLIILAWGAGWAFVLKRNPRAFTNPNQ